MNTDPSPSDAAPAAEAAGPRPSRRRWFRKRGIDLADLAVNSFAAFLGVFLALVVQNWTSSHEQAKRLTQARQAISEEIKSNKAVVEELIADYTGYEQQAKADKSAASTFENGCGTTKGWHGFQIPVVLRSAYETSLATGLLGQMQFGESQRISAAYATQIAYIGYLEKNLDWYVQLRIKEHNSCSSVFDDSLRILNKLVERYDEYLAAAQSTTHGNKL